jgi:hypothetical protein
MQAIRQALMARAQQQGGTPGMGQRPMTSALGQTTPGAPSAGAPQTPNQQTPQPQFSSPFAGPGAGQGFDAETKKLAKAMMTKLLSVF